MVAKKKESPTPMIEVKASPWGAVGGWAVRYVAVAAGTWLASRGYVNDPEAFAGGLVALGAAGYGLYKTITNHEEKKDLAESAPIGKVIGK